MGIEVVRQPSITARHIPRVPAPASGPRVCPVTGPVQRLAPSLRGVRGTGSSQWMWPTSALMVVSSPWPVLTTVSPCRLISRALIEVMIVGLSL
jgi:hypothetical protein